jgi:hypothetical protein
MNTHDVQFDAQTEAVIAKVRKLLALSNNNDNEHQAEAAANKARELLEAYNLDMAIINRQTNTFAPRDKQILRGGLYTWQRDLWNQVARLNFCKYWFIRGTHAGTQYEHELLGSKANVIASQIMANYLQEAIERLARRWVHQNRPGKSIFIKEAIAFREGVAARLSYRLWELREKRIEEEKARTKAERAANAERGIFTENALVLADVASTEEDLNNDHLCNYPPGTSARKRAESEARQAAAEKEAAELLRQQQEWDAAHPEEAAKRKAKEKAEYDRRSNEWWEKNKNKRPRKLTAEEERRRLGSYRAGYDKGDSISLDKQVDSKPMVRIK